MQNWHSLTVPSTSTLRQALEVLNLAGSNFVLIVDGDNKLLGTLTDGDVRRSLLNGEMLEDLVSNSMNENFIHCLETHSTSEITALLERHQINYLPALTHSGELVAVHSGDDNHLFPSRTALIMAGGLGSRLKPLTDDCPKPMLKVGDKPILQVIIERLASQGFTMIYISINYLGEQIRSYFGDGHAFNVSIKYIEESNKLGTAGAMGLLPKSLHEPIVVLNGDVLTKANYAGLVDYHQQHNALISIGLSKQEITIPYGVVNLDKEKVLSIDEKPTQAYYVSAGIYCVSSEVFGILKGQEYLDMPDLIQEHVELNNAVVGFPLHEYWADIGIKSDYKQANVTFKEIFENE